MTKPLPDERSPGEPPASESGRSLILVPIVHSQTDMGSHAEAVRRAYIAQRGVEAWRESRRAIDAFWAGVERTILDLDLDFARVRLYQDALPVCGHETDIVKDLAESGGANYRILLELVGRGATLEGTESPELLLREYELLKEGAVQEESAADLLRVRDRFIADRIDATLKPGEIGMLFVGALHHVAELLPETIAVLSLMDLETGPRSSPRDAG